ncbi:MAG: hypothetical protein LBS93_02670, partial [Synergistaceae bacterium]|nr:hypothetical protein [Synergistaceae bacterium]
MAAITLNEAARASGGLAVGDGGRIIGGVCTPADCREDMLCVAWDRGALEKIPPNIPVLAKSGTILGRDGVEHNSPRDALVDLLPLFERRVDLVPGIHPTASVAPGCSIGEDVTIGPCCVVSQGATIGDGTVLQANVFVGRDVVIGRCTKIEAGAA